MFIRLIYLLAVVLLELLTVALATSQMQNQQHHTNFKYYGNPNVSKIIEMHNDECHMFIGSDALWMYKTRHNRITVLNPIQFELLVERCHLKRRPSVPEMETTRNQEGEDAVNEVIPDGEAYFLPPVGNGTFDSSENTTDPSPIVYPGTKWCGRGATARSYDDLGIYENTDKCCRDHDNCADNIAAGATKHGLTNSAGFTSSHCDCDDQFLQCLRNDNSLSQLTSGKIAHIYFNILKPLCFAERHPSRACLQSRLTGECIRPEYDYRQARQWQFFSAQPYFAKTVRGLLDTFGSVLRKGDPTVGDPTSHSGRRSVAMPPGFTF